MPRNLCRLLHLTIPKIVVILRDGLKGKILPQFFNQEPHTNSPAGLRSIQQRRYIQILESTLLLLLSVLVYLTYHGLANLHDISHYIVAGISALRDHTDLVYPYSSMNPPGSTTAFSFFQDNQRLFSLYKSMPSKLYILSLGFLNAVLPLGWFFKAHMLSILALWVLLMSLHLMGTRYFDRVNSWLFVLSTTFYPLTLSVLSPGNDILGLSIAVLILALSLGSQFRLTTTGFAIGSMSHFRSQLLFLSPAMILLFSFGRFAKGTRLSRCGLLIATVISYLLISRLLSLSFPKESQYDGGISFYYNHYSNSAYSLNEWSTVLNRMFQNVSALIGINSLGSLLIASMILLFLDRNHETFGLLAAASFAIAVPLTIYSLDRTSLAQTRYYVYAVPLLIFAWFLFLSRTKHFTKCSVGTALFCVTLSISIYGLPLERLATLRSITDRLTYLDFQGASEVLQNNFEPEDLVILNHSLPTGYRKFKYILPLPNLADFYNSDNQEVDGILFVYSDTGVDAFFRPNDWIIGEKMPGELKDSYGNRFEKVAELQSGHDESAHFVVYKNAVKRVKEFDVRGNREFRTRYSSDLTFQRSKSPDFKEPGVWIGNIQWDTNLDGGVVTGPGSDNSNVLFQRLEVRPHERLRLRALAKSGRSGPSSLRLQFNWIGTGNLFLGTDLSVLEVGQELEEFKRTTVVPAGAQSAIFFASPAGTSDVIVYQTLEVLSAPPLDEGSP